MTTQPATVDRLREREAPDERPVMRQIWRHLGFLHWAVPSDALAPLLPPGLEPDTFDGVAYVGLVPFTIPLSRVAGVGLPIAPRFHELNLRTYVHRAGRAPGVWFFSLDAASRLAVAGARTFYGLPYFHARMSMEISGEGDSPTIVYSSVRRAGRGPAAAFQARYGPAAPIVPAPPETLAFFLAERYRLYAWNGRALSAARVHHAPYPLQVARVESLSETLTGAAGLPASLGPPAHVHYAREVDVRIYRPHRVDARAPADR